MQAYVKALKVHQIAGVYCQKYVRRWIHLLVKVKGASDPFHEPLEARGPEQILIMAAGKALAHGKSLAGFVFLIALLSMTRPEYAGYT